MNSHFAISLVVAHFVGDWYFQPRSMALAKSSNFKVLFKHLFIVSALLTPTMMYFDKVWVIIPNAIIHGLIDWNIWTYYKKKLLERLNGDKEAFNTFEYWKDKSFYDTVALDQCLHLVTLFVLCS